MKNAKKTLLVLTAVVWMLAACDQSGPDGSTAEANSPSQPVPGVTDTEVLLGAHSDLSGSIAIWGVGIANGARMRFEELEQAGGVHGRNVRYIVEDTQYQVPRAIQAANKLINRDEIFAMLLALGTPTNNAVLTQQLRAGVPNLFPLTGARSMAEPHHPLKFTARGIYYDEIQAAARYFIEEQGKTTPCVVYQDTEYGQETYEAAEDELKSMGLEIAAVSAHKPTESEFTAAMIRLRNAGCDLVLMGTVHRDTILVLEAARKMGLEGVAWVGSNAAYGQVIADQESGSGEGYYAFVHIAKLYRDDPLPEPVAQWWDRYVERFGEEPGLPAMEGYRSADLVVEALERAGRDLTRESFVAALESIDSYTDLFGYELSFSADNHNGVRQSTLSVVENGRWKVLETSITY